ncbi:ketoacyl-ACP synthase III [Amycolatopsis sp. NBC_01307]|uniref:3-oxoacyl-ACP synthase III family protein n=1 Tax=Amycolatopsis sp. NBC_01307 TaxID=2903561 RepID=UPI002E10C9BA|nr:ketoacyl-ACP synthase III [Amycolatopsis sp. NBC_01307]
MSIGILGTGSYLPKQEVSNAEVAERVGVDPEWIERKTRILNRRYAAPHEATSDLAAAAAVAALEQSGVAAAELDFLIVSTSTPDSPQPPTSAVVQNLIGARNAACFDLNVVCAGFVYALEIARGLLRGRPGGRVLVIGADLYSRCLDFGDRRTAVLLGDGAGAVVLGETAEGGLLATDLATRGEDQHLIRVEAGGTRLPASAETVAGTGHFFKMEGRAVRDFVLAHVPPAITALLARTGVRPSEVDHVVPHQPNGVLLAELVEHAGLGHAVTHRTLERYGNVGSACVPVALDAGYRAGAIRPGELVLFSAFGGGMSMGHSLIRWGLR